MRPVAVTYGSHHADAASLDLGLVTAAEAPRAPVLGIADRIKEAKRSLNTNLIHEST